MKTRHHHHHHHDRPLHARFVGRIVMTGFGSIGKGTLQLIERHIAFALTTFFIFFAPPAGQAGQPPAMTSYSGYFQGTSATKQAEPYAGIITHVTGYQNIKKQAEFQKNGLGYHFVIDKDGTIYQFGDPATTRSSHIQSEKYRTSQFDLTNRNALGVAFITGGKQPTKAQQAAAAQLIPFLQQKYNIPSGRVYGHGEVQGADPDRNRLGPQKTPEGQVMALPFRQQPSADNSASDASTGSARRSCTR
jgi:N-acetylmuramoyl-L-alanine amidase